MNLSLSLSLIHSNSVLSISSSRVHWPCDERNVPCDWRRCDFRREWRPAPQSWAPPRRRSRRCNRLEDRRRRRRQRRRRRRCRQRYRFPDQRFQCNRHPTSRPPTVDSSAPASRSLVPSPPTVLVASCSRTCESIQIRCRYYYPENNEFNRMI